jgi:hypothetical protein
MSQGGVHPRLPVGISVPAIGVPAAQAIYYTALHYLSANSGFTDMRIATVRAARELHGAGSVEVDAVCAAWNVVGVPSVPGNNECRSASPPPLQPIPPMPTNVHAAGEHCHGLNTVTWHGSGSTFRIWSYAPSRPEQGVRIFDGQVSHSAAGPDEYERAISAGDGAIIRVQACSAIGCSDISTSFGIATASTGCS